MQHESYPALFLDSDGSSDKYQSNFLWLIRGEYLMLFIASVFSLNFIEGVVCNLLYAAAFFAGLIILITRAQSKPEQQWYRCRALAESVKTLTWRYMMHAAPFNSKENDAKSELRDQLHKVFNENIATAKLITSDWSGKDQITNAMADVRSMNRKERMAYYLKHRVDDANDGFAVEGDFEKREVVVDDRVADQIGLAAFPARQHSRCSHG